MKTVILAGGVGSRLTEETIARPKPMVEIGGKPILWHIIKIYLAHGIKDFIICLGYRGYMVKEYFANYFLHMSDVTFDMASNKMEVHQASAEPWRVTWKAEPSGKTPSTFSRTNWPDSSWTPRWFPTCTVPKQTQPFLKTRADCASPSTGV